MRIYPLTIEPDDNGTLLVSLVDIPEAHTFAEDEDQISARATDCALTALEGYMKDRRPIPTPSRELKGRAVVLPPLAVAKIELYEAMRKAGVRKAELARRLRWHMPQVDRPLSLRHGSRLEARSITAGGNCVQPAPPNASPRRPLSVGHPSESAFGVSPMPPCLRVRNSQC